MEILLVEDGSPDKCGQVCDAYAKQDERVRVIHKTNGGLSDARNAGIEQAKGEYLAFVDSDDWIDDDMLQQLHRLCKQYDAQIAECSFRNIFPQAIFEETQCTADVFVGTPADAMEGLLSWKHFKPVVWNKLYHKSVIADIRYPKGMLHEDEFTTYRFFANAKKLVYVDVSKYNYDRTRTDSIMGKPFREANLDACFALHQRMEFLQASDMGDAQLQKRNRDAYCDLLLDRLYQCYKHKIKGQKVNEVLKMAAQDVEYFKQYPVKQKYLEELMLLKAKGLKKFGQQRDKQQKGGSLCQK